MKKKDKKQLALLKKFGPNLFKTLKEDKKAVTKQQFNFQATQSYSVQSPIY